ncbi:uncharacterized protein LOC143231596 isoform X1 [Tachypleus tridentatus]|uniref:uncharacterized protein LOC143231596 isoform X1 n=1 Tax=Tachypleus tridentatus TaxID=6853 RepID=UPI003FD2135C
MPDNYPDEDCPLVVFEPSIFHPLINIETGELDVKRGFQKWRKSKSTESRSISFASKCPFNRKSCSKNSALSPKRYRNYENEMWVLKPTMPLIFITIHYLQTKCGKVTALPSKEENELK